ncbi:hypothetical protein PAENIP36_55010 [Paenibacillus sp. P36]
MAAVQGDFTKKISPMSISAVFIRRTLRRTNFSESVKGELDNDKNNF